VLPYGYSDEVTAFATIAIDDLLDRLTTP
jgi:hypothetical protein